MTKKTLTEHNDTFSGSNNDDIIYGLGGNDSIFGSNGDDEIHGGNGDDILRAGEGDDRLYGDAGNDIMTLYKGNEKFYGGSGLDYIDLYYSTKGVNIDLNKDAANYNLGSKVYHINYTDMEAVYGSAHNDKETGNAKQNILRGEDGNDKIYGLDGDDVISGGAGRDVLSGGAGRDVFLFGYLPDGNKNFDRVVDFSGGKDRIAFNGTEFDVSASGKSFDVTDDYHFQTLASSQFQSGSGHAAANEDIRIIYDTKNGVLYYDSNGSDAGGLGQVADLGKNLDFGADSVFVYGL